VFAEWTPGISITYQANPRYYRPGEIVTSGGVSYEIGPFIDEYQGSIYGSDQETARALMNGEVDAAYLTPNPALQILLEENPDTVQYRNPTNVLWYLGFNLRKPPMNDLAFRQALATMVDRYFLANDVFQGNVQPTWTLLPEANPQWFDATAAAAIAAKYRNLDRFERLENAVNILEEAGYTWERRPSVAQDDRGKPSIKPGTGIRMPNGNPAPDLEILAFGSGSSGYFWFTSYSVYIEHWLTDLGFTARAISSTGHLLVSEVWPGVGIEPTFDLYLLGWGGVNAAFPTLGADVFHSRNLAEVNDGNNPVGYVNPEFDELADALYQVQDVDEAKQIMWQLEAMIDRDLPYVVLHHLFAPSAYRARVLLPYTEYLRIYDPELPALVRIGE
jgi:ABC-type transport system substrate-binding protein